jgi:hypothetical protein
MPARLPGSLPDGSLRHAVPDPGPNGAHLKTFGAFADGLIGLGFPPEKGAAIPIDAVYAPGRGGWRLQAAIANRRAGDEQAGSKYKR